MLTGFYTVRLSDKRPEEIDLKYAFMSQDKGSTLLFLTQLYVMGNLEVYYWSDSPFFKFNKFLSHFALLCLSFSQCDQKSRH